MDRLWSPWRYRYITTSTGNESCIFCDKPRAGDDRASLIVHRAEHNYVLLNLYPYTSGHLMVAPYAHVSTLEDADEAVSLEMMLLTRRAQGILRSLYRAPGYNIGMNIGAAAGAGVAGHIHMHAMPRWIGDAGFMTTVGETRILPEDLETTYERVSSAFRDS